MTAINEQRQHNRAPTQIHAAFQADGGEPQHCVVSNISLGGAWLEMASKLPAVNSEGRLHAVVESTHLYIIAKVVRQTAAGIGVSFIDMGIETYGHLKHLVEEASKAENQVSPLP